MTNRSKKKKKSNEFWNLLPGMLLFSIWPCTVHMNMADTNLEQYAWFPNIQSQGDFFLYDRGIVLGILVVWMLAILVDRVLLAREWKFQWKCLIPLGIYGLLSGVSALLSECGEIAFHGSAGQYESIWILWCYLIVAVYLSHSVRGKKEMEMLAAAMMAGVGMQVLIGLTQITGNDFWSSSVGKWLLTLGIKDPGELEFIFATEEKTKIYLSFYNPNYAGVYCILMLPILAAVMWNGKKSWKMASGILTIGLTACLIASGSKTGMITLGMLVFGILAVYIWNHHRYRLGGILLCGMAVGGLLFSRTSVYDSLKKSFTDTAAKGYLKDLVLEENQVQISYYGKKLYVDAVLLSESELLLDIRDEEGTSCPLVWNEDGTCTVDKNPFRKLRFDAYIKDDTMNLVFYQKSVPWIFTKPLEGGMYTYTNIYGRTDTIEKADALGFSGKERILSDRGYIFSRTLPLLKNYLLIGSGPDTFAVEFPQNDYIARANVGIRMYSEILTRPHNWYLQTWVQTGFLSLAALLAFIGGFLWKNRAVWKRNILNEAEKDKEALYHLMCQRGIYCSVLGYLVMALLNDSMVMTAPLFWGILGIGVGIGNGRHR